MFETLISDSQQAFSILSWGVLALGILCVQIIRPGGNRISFGMAAVGLASFLILDIFNFNSAQSSVLFRGAVVIDAYSQIFSMMAKAMALALTLMVFPGASVGTKFFKTAYEQAPEFLICLMFSGLGVSLLAASTDMTVLFLGLEILSVALYCMCGFYRTEIRPTESGLKYLLIGAFSTAIFLYGVAFLYGATGASRYSEILQAIQAMGPDALTDPFLILGVLFLMAGLAFKLAFVPFHLYTADVYEGAPSPVTGYLASIVKVGILAAAIRVLWGVWEPLAQVWIPPWVALCSLSILVGNAVALGQSSLKKLLAFSSISHAGFLGLAILIAHPTQGSTFALLSYTAVYSAMTLGLFAIVTLLESDRGPLQLEDLKGLWKRNIWAALGLGILILGLAGIPPFAGFMIKLWVLQGLVAQDYWAAAFVGIAGSLMGAAYYLKVLMIVFISEEKANSTPAPLLSDPVFSLRTIALLGALLTLIGGLRPQIYADWFFALK